MTTDHTQATERVLNLLDERRDAMVAALADLVAVPSVSGTDAENDAIAHMAGAFGAIGLDVDHWEIPLADTMARPDFPGVEVDRREAWGVVGVLRGAGTGEGRSLMLNGHVDVVPEGDPGQWTTTAFEPRVADGRLYGRGSCDMKAGMIASLWAVDAIRSAGVRLDGDLLLASVLGEEDGGLGTYATLQRGWRADACVIAEPTSLDLVAANAGALTFRLVVSGLATHAARRTEGVSALEKFIPVHRAILDLEQERNRDTAGTGSRFPMLYPISIGTVSCGDWASSVPDRLVAEGRLGVQLGEEPAVARRALEEAVAEACRRDPWLADHPVTVEWWGGQFASGRLPDDSDLLDRVRAAHHTVTGARNDDWVAPYGSDLRLLTGIGGIPTLQYGPGDALLAHGPDEHVPLDEVITTARTLAVLALDVCRVR
ncbi:MAG: ArgE/DapE family deacylase [Ilumatobacteraceae bacterium]